MYVDIADTGATVADTGDLTRLAVRARSNVSPHTIDEALQLSGLGLLRDGKALLGVDELRRTGPDGDAEWASAYTAMVGYAASRDWVADNGRYLVAHIETYSHAE